MRALFCALMLVFGMAFTPAQAATIHFTYSGVDQTPPFYDPFLGNLTVTTEGTGYFTGLDDGTITLGSLSDFHYSQQVTLNWSNMPFPPFPLTGVFDFRLASLTDFSATFAGGALTAISLSTDFVPDRINDFGFIFFNQQFVVNGLGPNGASTANLEYGRLTLGEFVIIQSAIPEPASWAMLIIGFGLIGWALRRSKARELAAA